MKQVIFILLLCLTGAMPLFAQEDAAALPPAQAVTIPAADGLEIQGDYYAPEGEGFPAVLLLHMLDKNRSGWNPLIPALVEQGIAVLAVDQRGHGETGGRKDWTAAETDVQTLLDWLKNQSGVTQVAIVGGSIGSNLSLRGMANDETVVTAVALSPGLDYRGVKTEDAVAAIGARPILLVGSRRDSSQESTFDALIAAATGDLQVRYYAGRVHGTDLLESQPFLGELVIDWLLEQFAVAAAAE